MESSKEDKHIRKNVVCGIIIIFYGGQLLFNFMTTKCQLLSLWANQSGLFQSSEKPYFSGKFEG